MNAKHVIRTFACAALLMLAACATDSKGNYTDDIDWAKVGAGVVGVLLVGFP